MAAAGIIASEGLEALTTRNLARSMGYSIGVLSHYFTSKDQIVIAAISPTTNPSSSAPSRWTSRATWSGAYG
jgi:AcrR family transcriptional regulator